MAEDGAELADSAGEGLEEGGEGGEAALDGGEGGGFTADDVMGKVLGAAGIGLGIYITVEDCEHGTVSQCVGDSVGVAIATGCLVATDGFGSVVCGLAAAAMTYVITTYGPQIAQAFVDLGGLHRRRRDRRDQRDRRRVRGSRGSHNRCIRDRGARGVADLQRGDLGDRQRIQHRRRRHLDRHQPRVRRHLERVPRCAHDARGRGSRRGRVRGHARQVLRRGPE